MHLSTILPATLLVATALAAPLAPRGPTKTAAPSAESIILATAPKSSSCDPATDFATECRTAAQAAPYLIKAFSDHKVYAPAEISALLSLIAFETGDLKYNRNHFPAPGRPGQGTRRPPGSWRPSCVGTEVTDDRVAYWQRAKDAFGI
ncbi:hypothetical protein BN1723_014102 [Verticillium longisporum]|uniref:Uncharacterized protein n=1 Tax=Verticillium longisporum TaxID=100787 RepID=A0A0G4M1S7_VERLO|nr:hypothetical protein BN1723_014102 [Verticillium longisporum]